MGFTSDELVKELPRRDLEILCFCLLNKRECDGLNKRPWDTFKHWDWETRLSIILNKYNYLGNINYEAIKAHNKYIHPTGKAAGD